MQTLLDAARSGMIEHERNVERVAHNLANINTVGYKKLQVRFRDVFDTQTYLDLITGQAPPPEQQTSSAVVGDTESRDFGGGPAQATDRPFDLAIEGEGFFEVQLPDGTLAYTRDGAFWPDAEGSLVTTNGYRLQPSITVAAGTRDIIVQPNGVITGMPADAKARQELGTLTLARFLNPSGLLSIGENLYAATVASGEPENGAPGDTGFGSLQSGFLEGSNVDLAEEMTSLMMAQRAYQLNAALYRHAEEMYRMANQLSA